MAHSRSAEKEAFWQMAVDEQQCSGLSIKAFCRQQGLSEPSFYAWRKKLQKRDAPRDDSPSPFLPVRVLPATGSNDRRHMESLRITTPSGFTVSVCDQEAAQPAVNIAIDMEKQWRASESLSC